MIDGWENTEIGKVILKTKLKDPTKEPEKFFYYVDVSSVSNILFKIEEPNYLSGKDAPSRARKLIQSEDIIFATVRPTLKRIAFVPNELDGQICSTGYCVLKADKKQVNPLFLYFSLLPDYFMERIEKLQRGASYPAIRDYDLKSQKIFLPPLPEQRKIAYVLTTVQKAIEQQDKLIRHTTELKKALMQKLFIEGTKGEKQKQTEIGLVPESWEEITIGDFGKCVTGTTPKTAVEDYWNSNDYDFIAPADIGITKYVYNSAKMMSSKGLKVSRILPKDSVLCVCIGSSIGKVGLSFKDQSATNQQINSIICKADYNSIYTYYLLVHFAEHWRGHATFGPVPILNKGQFELIKIFVTNDKKEQKQIAESLQTFDNKIEFHGKKKQSLNELFKTLLHELMTGERRVYEINFKALAKEYKIEKEPLSMVAES